MWSFVKYSALAHSTLLGQHYQNLESTSSSKGTRKACLCVYFLQITISKHSRATHIFASSFAKSSSDTFSSMKFYSAHIIIVLSSVIECYKAWFWWVENMAEPFLNFQEKILRLKQSCVLLLSVKHWNIFYQSLNILIPATRHCQSKQLKHHIQLLTDCKTLHKRL